MSPKIEKLIVKYITKSATSSDLDILSEWVNNPINKKVFKDYVQTHYVIFYSMNNPDTKKVLDELMLTIKKEKSLVYRIKKQPIYKYAAAAVVVGIMVSAYLFKDNKFNNPVEITPIIVNNSIESGTDKATLTLEDGSQVALEKGDSFQTQNANSNGEELVYEAGSRKAKEIGYNYLTIPRGGQFFVKLADGTQVWLNSESQLKYPVAFLEGVDREVELVYGEAYFDVSPSSDHKGSKFRVFNQSQEIEVLGTEFNLKAYKDETNIYTTLVEGKVAVNFENRIQQLLPNQQSNFNLNSNSITIKKVDVYSEISWKDGIFSFEDVSLEEIMKVLSRWYDIEVVFGNENLKNEEFIGLLRKDQNIEKIISTIKGFGIIKEYEFKDKILILK
tara:strand:- start:242 stop:1408 length:1167 start_codon:yes stop_codon:yes gene_type:complete